MLNPASGDQKNAHPPIGNSTEAVPLKTGHKVNLPGPITFPLWPGQTATAIGGHHLRHNQYLIVRVYNENEARENWSSAVVKSRVVQDANSIEQHTDITVTATTPALSATQSNTPILTMGQLMLVKGTDVSFYIPPTGIEVVPEKENFVREAVTLERLEYCILLGEDGNKNFQRGPAVVFPQPTERFIEAEGNRKFRAIELNEITGLHIKVIANYEDENGNEDWVGEELFITGVEQAIYFPRQEHSIVMYDGKQKHHAIAIPAGEGRYVLDRQKGSIDLVYGPTMFLPDPRTQVVVRRVLDKATVELLYPDNKEALEQNGIVTEPDFKSAVRTQRDSTGLLGNPTPSTYMGDGFQRGSGYTPPRTLVLTQSMMVLSPLIYGQDTPC